MKHTFSLMVCSLLFSTCLSLNDSPCKNSREGSLSNISQEALNCFGLTRGWYALSFGSKTDIIIDSIAYDYYLKDDSIQVNLAGFFYYNGSDCCYDYKLSGKTYQCENNPDVGMHNTKNYRGAILTFWEQR